MNITSDIIVPLFSAFLGGFISIWIYRQGINDQKKKEKEKEVEDNKQMEEYFRLNIQSILQFINFQIDQITMVCSKTKNWEARNLSLAILPELKLTEIREIDFKYLFQILVLNKKGEIKKKSEDFINIKNSIHNIEDFIQKQKSINEVLDDSLNKNVDLWNSSLKSLLQFNNKFVSAEALKNDSLMSLIQSKVVVRQREIIQMAQGNNLDVVFNEVLHPIIIEIPNFVDFDHRIPDLLDILMSGKQAYQSMRYIRYERRKSLLFAGRNLLSVKKLLQDSMNSFEEEN